MPKGIALHIGINEVDATHYKKNEFEGWAGALKGCEADALVMKSIAEAQGFETNLLLTKAATRASVRQGIEQAAEKLEAGDYFLITYSGHGGQVLDISRDEKKDKDMMSGQSDIRDETWCLYDAQILDDELRELWTNFKSGVRILLFSDSCHSGTVVRDPLNTPPPPPPGLLDRVAPKDSFDYTYIAHKDLYDKFQVKVENRAEITAQIISFAACQDDQLSREDQSEENPGGLFTKSVQRVWDKKGFTDYKSFFESIKKDMEGLAQTPHYLTIGDHVSDFEGRMPLELG